MEPPRPAPLTPARERELAERARHDIEAFSELYQLYLPRIHAFAWRRTGNTQIAEDICAATFEAALRAMPRFTWRRGGFGAWLFRIAANQCATHYRREKRADSDRGQQAMAALHSGRVEDDLEPILAGSDHAALRHALDQLNSRYQRALSLRYLADLDTNQAADAMGLAKPAFAVVLSRALKALRSQLRHDSSTAKEVDK